MPHDDTRDRFHDIYRGEGVEDTVVLLAGGCVAEINYIQAFPWGIVESEFCLCTC